MHGCSTPSVCIQCLCCRLPARQSMKLERGKWVFKMVISLTNYPQIQTVLLWYQIRTILGYFYINQGGFRDEYIPTAVGSGKRGIPQGKGYNVSSLKHAFLSDFIGFSFSKLTLRQRLERNVYVLEEGWCPHIPRLGSSWIRPPRWSRTLICHLRNACRPLHLSFWDLVLIISAIQRYVSRRRRVVLCLSG